MNEWIIDACCLINLLTTDMEASILGACQGEFHISTQVQSEALTIRRLNEDEPPRLVSDPINLASLFADGLIHECEPNGQAELDAYVRFATQLGDGEASCLAIANSRGWTLATDDRKATRVAAEAGVAVVTTPELVYSWALSGSASNRQVAEALRRIEQLARFRPRSGSSRCAWWRQTLDDAAG